MKKPLIALNPSIRSIAFAIIGISFFGTFSFLILSSNWQTSDGTSQTTANVIIWSITSIFLFFTGASLVSLLATKIIKLYEDKLVIVRPLLFMHKTIFIEEIETLDQEEHIISAKYSTAYSGLKTSIILNNGHRIKLNSFDSTHYNLFNKYLNTLVVQKRGLDQNEIQIVANDKWKGIGWLIFAIIATSLIMWAVFVDPGS